jgi:hypothetical protein
MDAGYIDVELMVNSQFKRGVRIIGPARADVS